jgi:acyl-[acyl carrier protein]--UDP-N-acetylglucosamine O-acyltransferase
MVGMGAVCTKKLDITPGGIFVGNPAKYLRQNTVGLQRNNVTDNKLEEESLRWQALKETNTK